MEVDRLRNIGESEKKLLEPCSSLPETEIGTSVRKNLQEPVSHPPAAQPPTREKAVTYSKGENRSKSVLRLANEPSQAICLTSSGAPAQQV